MKENSQGGVLQLEARTFKPIIGGDYCLTASFDCNEEEPANRYNSGIFKRWKKSDFN